METLRFMTKLFEKFSSVENLKEAYEFLKKDMVHTTMPDDPITNPFLDIIDSMGDIFFVSLQKYLMSGKYNPQRSMPMYFQKNRVSLRPFMVMSIIDRIVYQAIFNPEIYGLKIDSQLEDAICLAKRINRSIEGDQRFLINYSELYSELIQRQELAFTEGFIFCIELDISNYYQDILHDKLIKKLEDFGVNDINILKILENILTTQNEFNGLKKSIPQGLTASDILGNVYLDNIDKISSSKEFSENIRLFRYVDNIYIYAKKEIFIQDFINKILPETKKDGLNIKIIKDIHKIESSAEIIVNCFPSEGEQLDDDEESIDFEPSYELELNIDLLLENSEPAYIKRPIRDIKKLLSVNQFNETLIIKLIELIEKHPILIIYIVRNIIKSLEKNNNEARKRQIISLLLEKYNSPILFETTKIWIFKLLLALNYFDEELFESLNGNYNDYYLVVKISFYISNNTLTFKRLFDIYSNAKFGTTKAYIMFFITLVYEQDLDIKVINIIQDGLNSSDHDLNIVSFFLIQKLKIKTSFNFKYSFGSILNGEPIQDLSLSDQINNDYFLIKKDSLRDIKTLVGITPYKKTRLYKNNKPDLFIGNNEVDMSFEKLESWKDGRITYNNVNITMRPQIKDLCRVFLNSNGRLVTFEDIKENIIKYRKRSITTNATISKYVSELQGTVNKYTNSIEFKSESTNGYKINKK